MEQIRQYLLVVAICGFGVTTHQALAAPAEEHHTLTLTPNSAWDSWQDRLFHDTPVIGTFTGHGVTCVKYNAFPGPIQGKVGFGQGEWGSDPCMSFIVEHTVGFDTGPYKQIPSKRLDRVVLTYDEAPFANCTVFVGSPYSNCWQGGSGAAVDKPTGCVTVRVPNIDWQNRGGPKGLMPFNTKPGTTQIRRGEWDVTEAFRWQADSGMPIGGNPGFGFTLGSPFTSTKKLTAEDNTVCVSDVKNVRLIVSYTTFPNDVFVQPK
ncbi:MULTISPECIES: hypothetical protein [unclassified Mesorhizobium]|uniref:hypothetical protein n=1 Tax=unclassified Mesorhizobium TaxID=325217 RepID=UPI000BAFCC2C|nr:MULTISPECIES: hypothetical protein [unclassified Mesorhizobium]PBC23490.1 hypothetical protein CK226_10220 [Mesorhizobium sp. WSM4311]TRD06856.1 hypothetical protein FJV82_09010 [Mesorhizobium sp. WSM4305]